MTSSGRARGLTAAVAALRFLPALLALAAFWCVDDARLALAAAAAAVPLFLWAARASLWWSAALPFGAARRGSGVARGSLSVPARFLLLLAVTALMGALAVRFGYSFWYGDWNERGPRAEERASWSIGRLFDSVGGFRFDGDDGQRFRLRCAMAGEADKAGGGRGGSASCFSAQAQGVHGLAVSVLHGPVSEGLVPTAAVYEVRAGRDLLVDRLRLRARAHDAAAPGRLLGRIGLLLMLGMLVWTLAPFLAPTRTAARRRAMFRLPEA